jgi:hypothetical protein
METVETAQKHGKYTQEDGSGGVEAHIAEAEGVGPSDRSTHGVGRDGD